MHALRVLTLRIQAEVEDELDGLPSASHEAQSMMRFGKVAGRLRDSLGLVREMDVWIGKLRKLSESLNESAGYVPRTTQETVRQIERLERRLGRKRERTALKLVAEIEKRGDDLLLASRHLESAIGQQAHEDEGKESAKLLKEFAGIAMESSVLDEGNLHDFRKRIKKIRYRAEIHDSDPVCRRIAAHMKKAQAAIGEWHDWQMLARTAGRGKHAKDSEAVELLSNLTAETYEAALASSHGALRQMAELDQNVRAGLHGEHKVPVRSETAASISACKLA